ncbi:hypothetical protein TSOC_010261 [Tetrabaena socialis]|uniref:Uncharacterized protein n=1 Tax=Tetrabaena socialis TaxID=47790 RepID=A0A2J7ZTQ6_9CHLO|nr:hypothetical protein TSOC_010261 [Tetrabaena socialis]|eukprot:PNH03657.1 hypothetical protein TSOC_010261 [Tetrabaena socialis]
MAPASAALSHPRTLLPLPLLLALLLLLLAAKEKAALHSAYHCPPQLLLPTATAALEAPLLLALRRRAAAPAETLTLALPMLVRMQELVVLMLVLQPLPRASLKLLKKGTGLMRTEQEEQQAAAAAQGSVVAAGSPPAPRLATSASAAPGPASSLPPGAVLWRGPGPEAPGGGGGGGDGQGVTVWAGMLASANAATDAGTTAAGGPGGGPDLRPLPDAGQLHAAVQQAVASQQKQVQRQQQYDTPSVLHRQQVYGKRPNGQARAGAAEGALLRGGGRGAAAGDAAGGDAGAGAALSSPRPRAKLPRGAGSGAVRGAGQRSAGRGGDEGAGPGGGGEPEPLKLPGIFVSQCNAMNEVWVPSQWAVDVFKASGVDPHKLVILPEGVNTTWFDPDLYEPMPMPQGDLVFGLNTSSNGTGARPFRLLSTFKWEPRKGWDVLLEAYLTEFTAEDDVELFIITKPFVGGGDFRTHMHKCDGRAADAFVLPSRGEGWGRPHVEAMAMGLPLIATNWSGITAYLDESVGYPIDVERLTTVSDNSVWWFRGLKWAQPSVRHTRQLMRRVYSHREEARARGAAGRRRMVERYSPDVLAAELARQLRRIDALIPKLPPPV